VAKEQGAEVIREAGAMNAGNTIVAFLKDPDGYEIELLSKKFD
jgi:lactoylglutathione lyase